MKYLTACVAFAAVAITAAALTLPLPSATSEPCGVPREQGQPAAGEPGAALQRQLGSQGWQSRRTGIGEGCYAVYGLDGDGQRREVSVGPRALAPVAD